MYGKLENEVLTYYDGGAIEINGFTVTNPTENIILQSGFKPIEEAEKEEREGFFAVPVFSQDDEKIYVNYDYEVIPQPTSEELRQEAENREIYFNTNFFETSLGYIRRKVNMAHGGVADFLRDLFPTIALAVGSGQAATVLAYDKPSTFESDIDYLSLQNEKPVTPQFIQECFSQVKNDFKGGGGANA